MTDQVRMRVLLKDSLYRQWIQRVPDEYDAKNRPTNGTRPWRVFIQLEQGGRWGLKDFKSYRKALKFFIEAIRRGVWDATINHKVHLSGRPMLRPRAGGKAVRWDKVPEGHLWCPLCRRPTVFRFYPGKRHPNMPGVAIRPDVLRCSICGASSNFTRRYW